jgi:hypothetical protein
MADEINLAAAPTATRIVYRLVAHRRLFSIAGATALFGDVTKGHRSTPHAIAGMTRLAAELFAASRKFERLGWAVSGYDSRDDAGELGAALLVAPTGDKSLPERTIDAIRRCIRDGVCAVEAEAHRRHLQTSILQPADAQRPDWLSAEACQEIADHWCSGTKSALLSHGHDEMTELNIQAPEQMEPQLVESFVLGGEVDLVGRSELRVCVIGTLEDAGESDKVQRRKISGTLGSQGLLDFGISALTRQIRVRAHISKYSNNAFVFDDLGPA